MRAGIVIGVQLTLAVCMAAHCQASESELQSLAEFHITSFSWTSVILPHEQSSPPDLTLNAFFARSLDPADSYRRIVVSDAVTDTGEHLSQLPDVPENVNVRTELPLHLRSPHLGTTTVRITGSVSLIPSSCPDIVLRIPSLAAVKGRWLHLAGDAASAFKVLDLASMDGIDRRLPVDRIRQLHETRMASHGNQQDIEETSAFMRRCVGYVIDEDTYPNHHLYFHLSAMLDGEYICTYPGFVFDSAPFHFVLKDLTRAVAVPFSVTVSLTPPLAPEMGRYRMGVAGRNANPPQLPSGTTVASLVLSTAIPTAGTDAGVPPYLVHRGGIAAEREIMSRQTEARESLQVIAYIDVMDPSILALGEPVIHDALTDAGEHLTAGSLPGESDYQPVFPLEQAARARSHHLRWTGYQVTAFAHLPTRPAREFTALQWSLPILRGLAMQQARIPISQLAPGWNWYGVNHNADLALRVQATTSAGHLHIDLEPTRNAIPILRHIRIVDSGGHTVCSCELVDFGEMSTKRGYAAVLDAPLAADWQIQMDVWSGLAMQQLPLDMEHVPLLADGTASGSDAATQAAIAASPALDPDPMVTAPATVVVPPPSPQAKPHPDF